MSQWVYSFGSRKTDGDASMVDLLGGKGANLAEMSSLGLPVPPGFTLSTDVCAYYLRENSTFPVGLRKEVRKSLDEVEAIMNLTFGQASKTLLVSVRSGARVSMPGMMDTVLNVGLNDQTVKGIAEKFGDDCFAYDSYRRFLQMYGDVVLGIEHHLFEDLLDEHKAKKGVTLDGDMNADDWRDLVDEYKVLVKREIGTSFPQDPTEQLWGAIGAVFGSWLNRRAVTYRMLHDIPEEWGTAVTIQAMVYGNIGNDCGAGVAFTRDPISGANVCFGEYLINAQGEDIVAGLRTPQPISKSDRHKNLLKTLSMEEDLPEVYDELTKISDRLERHYLDMQDIEFTIQHGQLWLLQTRCGKRTTKAAIKIAVDMVAEGLIGKTEAIARINPRQLDQVLHPTLDPDAEPEVLGFGLPASPGAISGRIVFNSADAKIQSERGNKVILVRTETSPEDISGMHFASGIVTTRGGITSHAAVVARGMGTPCVSGAGFLAVDCLNKTLCAAGKTFFEGEFITIDGASGKIMKGKVPTIKPEFSNEFSRFMEWVDEIRKLGVRANIENPADVKNALAFGAEGIGLYRTEHMFFHPDRINFMREIIIAVDEKKRRKALNKLLDFQRQDFSDLFTNVGKLPVAIRLFDPPLHEFLPRSDDEILEVANFSGLSSSEVKVRTGQLSERNPMLGHRGCRLGVTYPEIYEMQIRAIFEAAVDIISSNMTVVPQIMIPLISKKSEFEFIKAIVDDTAEAVKREKGLFVDYYLGTMIELPNAAICSGEIAIGSDFMSFGTNDLTQTTLGLSRDDTSSIIQTYLEKSIFLADPFVSLDKDGVGELVKIATQKSRAVRPNIQLGASGEHGGDASSVQFFHEVGLDYVSCSPYRLPIARLAAAQAEMGIKKYCN